MATTAVPAGVPTGAPAAVRPPVPMPSAPRASGLSMLSLGLFAAVAASSYVGGLGGLYPPLYVGAAAATALVQYYQRPGRFVGFVILLWFITPMVRRMHDWHYGFNPTNIILTAPVAATMVSGLTVLYRAKELRGRMMYPYVFTLGAVLYGYAIGAIKAGFLPATYGLLLWLAPLLFSMHLALSWRHYPVLREGFTKFMQWALLPLGLYGIYQLARPPAWDTYWMQAAEIYSIGAPIPYGFRIFGSMNTPGPYAAALAVAMIFMLAAPRRFSTLSLSIALVALMLTRVRSAWVALVVGLLIVQLMGPIRKMGRNWLVAVLMVLLALPLLSLDVFRDTITKRLQSFAEISKDNSFKQRVILGNAATMRIASTAEGEGLGSTGGGTKLQGGGGLASIDNGFLEVFFTLGWPGGALLIIGLAGHLLTLARYRDARIDSFANGARAVFFSLLAVLLLGDIFSGSIGTLYWGALGFASSAHAYHLASGAALRSRQWAAAAAAAAPLRAPGSTGHQPAPTLSPRAPRRARG